MNDYLKLAIARGFSYFPGKIGSRFETSALWAERAIRARSAEDDFARELQLLGPDDICVDLGANVGIVTEQLAAVAGQVHAFEPDPWAFSQLRERVGNLPNVLLYNAAIGPENGTLALLRDPGLAEFPEERSQGSSAFPSLLWQSGEPEKVEVPMMGIDEFLEKLDGEIALMKIDIEGGEVALLEALLAGPNAQRIRSAFVETHECQIPELRPATKAMRARLAQISKPKFYLEWH